MIFLGLDPGKSGGVAVHSGTIVIAECWPETESDIWDLLRTLTRSEPDLFAMIEKVHSMPKQGVASSFTFGRGYGFLRGCLVGLGIPFEEVTPQKWQKAMGCMSKGNKNVTKAKAQQLFPYLDVTHAVADAILISEYCRRVRTGEGVLV